jgi:hypothetical protein
MKFIGGFLLLVFGIVWDGTAQEAPKSGLDSAKTRFSPRFKFDLPENLRLFSPDTSLLDSGIVFFPRSLSIDRELNPVSVPYQSRMPLLPLSDPQSRMPIKTFDDSVNYTILKKEYK